MMKRIHAASSPAPVRRPKPATYALSLYIGGATLKSQQAAKNLRRICEEYLQGRYALEVIDILQQARLARAEQIVAVPTLIKRTPLPLRRLVGDMSNIRSVLCGLDLGMREN